MVQDGEDGVLHTIFYEVSGVVGTVTAQEDRAIASAIKLHYHIKHRTGASGSSRETQSDRREDNWFWRTIRYWSHCQSNVFKDRYVYKFHR